MKILKLQECCMLYGDYKVTTFLGKDKIIPFTKHKSVLEIWENIDIEGWRLERATDRTPYNCECVLDVDPEKDESKLDFENRFKNIIKDLKKRKVEYKAYSTGGKGYHIHLFIYGLSYLSPYQRANVRRELILFYKCDMMKASDNMMVLMEGEPNRKTGKIKKEVIL